MAYNPEKHHRRSIRLQGYDYSQAGMYFVTICCNNKTCLFEKIVDDEIILNDTGHIAYNEWVKTSEIRDNVTLDTFVIMPNHIHGIIILETNGRGVSHTPKNITKLDDTVTDNNVGVCNTPLQSTSKNIGV